MSLLAFLSLILNIIAVYQFFVQEIKSSKEQEIYFEQFEAILRTCQQNSTFYYAQIQHIISASFMEKTAKFGLVQNCLENQSRWNTIADTVFGLMKSVDPKRLKKYKSYNLYLSDDGLSDEEKKNHISIAENQFKNVY